MSKLTEKLTGKLTVHERLNNSLNGNPNYSCSINGVLFSTKNDSSYCYELTNFDGQLVDAEVKVLRGKLKLESIQKHPLTSDQQYIERQFAKRLYTGGPELGKILLSDGKGGSTNWLDIKKAETFELIKEVLLADRMGDES